MAAAGLVVATAASAVSAPAAQAAPGPVFKLIAAQHTVTVTRSGNQVFVDPGIWVASLGAPLQLDVGRASYTQPVTITQVMSQPGLPPQTRALPASILDGWNGLKNFISLTIRNKAGRARRRRGPPARLPAVPLLASPPESALPDLVPLPAWGIRTFKGAGHDLLSFSATVWVGGNGQLDVQGFRANSSPVMPAYQYF